MDNCDIYFDDNENLEPVIEQEEKELPELPITIKFDRPVSYGKTKRTEIVLANEPTGKMLKHIPMREEDIKQGHMLPIISGMAGWTSTEVEMLPVRELKKCFEAIVPFLA